MPNYAPDQLLTAIDIGTTKICVLVAHKLDADNVDIIGVGTAPSDGLCKGVVVDVAKTIKSIKTAVQEAEIMADITIERAYIGISGSHIKSLQSHGMVPILKGRVSQQDIDNVLQAAMAIPTSEDEQIIHALAQYFIIDGKDQVADPRDMHGVRLEISAHIILGSVASVQNLVTCCEAAGVQVVDVVLEQLASAQAVLSEDEKELGAAILDIGGGTADFALYKGGSIRHSMVLPIAGNHFTKDIALVLATTMQDAERIKKEYGIEYITKHQKDTPVEIEMAHGEQKRTVLVSEIAHIAHARAQELLQMVAYDKTVQHLKSYMQAGFVLTGGGSLLKGLDDLARTFFPVPVRIGKPHHNFSLPQSLKSPIYATSYGLIVYALKQQQTTLFRNQDAPLTHRIFTRMKSWVSDFF